MFLLYLPMFLQILTEHQGHFLTRLGIAALVMAGILFFTRYYKKKPSKTKPVDLEFMNYDEERKRKYNRKLKNKSKKR
jgi:hypothetical protein